MKPFTIALSRINIRARLLIYVSHPVPNCIIARILPLEVLHNYSYYVTAQTIEGCFPSNGNSILHHGELNFYTVEVLASLVCQTLKIKMEKTVWLTRTKVLILT